MNTLTAIALKRRGIAAIDENLRTPDALQAASCMNYSMEHCFLTGDKAFGRVEGLTVTLLTT